MQVNYTNVNTALPDLVDILIGRGVRMGSRNGEVISLPHPITVTTVNPMQRVCLIPERKANPFLFLLDGLSILSQVDLVAPLASIVPRMSEFSDDGVTLRGHYGKRLYDLIPRAIEMLAQDEYTRRCVMSIWDNERDLGMNSVDIPCNLMVIPRIVDRLGDKALDMTIVNRSNDLFWGMMGANIVQFSFLQELMARALEVKIGHLSQMSTNLHFYTGFGPGMKVTGKNVYHCPYISYPEVRPLDVENIGFREFQQEVDDLMFWMADIKSQPSPKSVFLSEVAIPMMIAWKRRSAADLVGDCDWFMAARIYFREA